MPILPSQRHHFDIPNDVAYLNCAYMSPLSHSVIRAGAAGLERKRRPWTVQPADFFSLTQQARETFARLLGPAATAEDIAIVPAASYGMATAAANLPLKPGDRVLVLEGEFPSTILTWRAHTRECGAELVTLTEPADHDWTRVVLGAIDERTRVAALPALHWISGARIDLAAVRRRLREVKAALVLDLTQSLGAMPFDVGDVDPDFMVAACYKWLLGPYTTGFLYVAPRHHNGRPLEHHWFGRKDSQNFSGLAYPEEFQPGARRFDMGEPSNFALLPGAVAALEMILGWGVENISATAGAFADDIVARGGDLGLTAVPAKLRAPHYVGLTSRAGLPPGLTDRLGISRVFVSVRGGRSLRITPHVYNEPADVDRLFQVLAPALA